MMWFFAILIVLALGGVALVASGHGSSMAVVHPDRADLALDPERDLVARDLREVHFSTAVRGYRMSEVDELLSRLARQLEDAGITPNFDEPATVDSAWAPTVPTSSVASASRTPRSPGTDELAADQAANAEQFVAYLSGNSADEAFDFSPGTLAAVDDLLGAWGGSGQRSRRNTITAAGAYVGEVIVRNVPGSRWVLLPEVFGDVPVVEVPGSGHNNPIGKAFKRVENGPEDSVRFFFEALAGASRKTQNGADDGGSDAP